MRMVDGSERTISDEVRGPILPVVPWDGISHRILAMVEAHPKTRVRLRIHGAWRAAVKSGAGVVAFACSHLRAPEFISELVAATARTSCEVSFIVLTNDEGSKAACLLRTGVEDVFWVPMDIPRLNQAVLCLCENPFENAFARIMRLMSGKGLVPSVLSRIRQSANPSDPVLLMSLGDLAKAVGCSASHLRGVAREAGLDLGRLRKLALLERAVRLRSHGAISWEQVSLKMGYEGSSGLANLARRTVGLPLSDLELQWREASPGWVNAAYLPPNRIRE
jgi:AraC-like DNA-binding protein